MGRGLCTALRGSIWTGETDYFEADTLTRDEAWVPFGLIISGCEALTMPAANLTRRANSLNLSTNCLLRGTIYRQAFPVVGQISSGGAVVFRKAVTGPRYLGLLSRKLICSTVWSLAAS